MSTVDELLKMFSDQFNLAFAQLDERRLENEGIKKSIEDKTEKIDAKITILAKNMKEIKGKIESMEKKFEDISMEKVESKISELTELSILKNLEKTNESFNLIDPRIESLEIQNNHAKQGILDFNKAIEDRDQEINAKIENLSKEIESVFKSHEHLNIQYQQFTKESLEKEKNKQEILPGLKEEEVKALLKQYNNDIQNSINTLSDSISTFSAKQISIENILDEVKVSFLTKDEVLKINDKSLKEIAELRTEIENSLKKCKKVSFEEFIVSEIDEKIISVINKETEKHTSNYSQALKDVESKFEQFSTKQEIENLKASIFEVENSIKLKFDSEVSNLNTKLEGCTKTNVFNSKLEQLKAFMTSKLETMLDEESAKINEEHKFTQSKIEGLENELKPSIEKALESFKSIESMFNKEIKQSNDSLDNKYGTLCNELQNSILSITSKMNKLEELEREIESKISKDIITLTENLAIKISNIEQREQSLNNSLQVETKTLIQDLSSKLCVIEENAKEDGEKIRKELTEIETNTTSKISFLEDQFQNSSTTFIAEFKSQLEDIEKKLKDLEETSKEQDSRLTKNLESSINDISTIMTSIKDHEKANKDNLEQELKLSIENLSQQIKGLEEHEKLSKSDLSKHFENSISKVLSKMNVLEDQHKEHKDNFEQELGKLDSKLTQSEKRITEESENSLTQSLSSLGSKLMDAVTEVSNRTTSTINEINVSIELVRQNIKKIVSDNQTSLSYQADQFKLSFADMEEKLKQAISNLTKQFESEFLNYSIKQSDLQKLLETHINEKDKELHAKIESYNDALKLQNEKSNHSISILETRIEEVATRVENIKQDIDDRIDKEIEIINNDQTSANNNIVTQKTALEKFSYNLEEFQNKIENLINGHQDNISELRHSKDSFLVRLENIEPKVLNFKENDDTRYSNFIEEFRKEKSELELKFEELQKKADNMTNLVEEALVSDVTSFKKSIQLLTESSQAVLKDIKDIRELEMIELRNDNISEIENLSKKLAEFNSQSDAKDRELDEKMNKLNSTLEESIEKLSNFTQESINRLNAESKVAHEQLENTFKEQITLQKDLIQQHNEDFNNFRLENTNYLKDLEAKLLSKMSNDAIKFDESIQKTNERFKERCNLQESKLNELRQEVEDQNCTEDVKKLDSLINSVKSKQEEEFLGIKKKLISQDSSTKELEDYWNITYLNLKEKVQVLSDSFDTLKKKMPDGELVQRIPKIEEGMVRTNKAIANLDEHHKVDFASYKEKNQTEISELDKKLSERISQLSTISQDLSNKTEITFEKISLEAQALSKVVHDHFENRVTSQFVLEAIEKESTRLLNLIQKTDVLIIDVEKKIGEQTVQYKTDIECLSKTVESAKKAYDNYNNKVSELAESDRKIQKEIQRMINFNDIQQDDIEIDNGAQTTQEMTENESGLSSNFEYKTDFDELVTHVQSSLKNQQEGFAKGVQAEVDSLSKLMKENHKILNQKTLDLDTEHKKLITKQKSDSETLQGICSKLIEVTEGINHLNHALNDTTKSVWDTIGIMNDRIYILERRK